MSAGGTNPQMMLSRRLMVAAFAVHVSIVEGKSCKTVKVIGFRKRW